VVFPLDTARVPLDADAAELVDRLCALALDGLPAMYRADSDEFVFTRAFGRPGPRSSALRPAQATAGATARPEQRGTSTRYAAIVALGAHWLGPDQQRQVLGGHTVAEYVGLLIGRLPRVSNLGDAALIAWAAAQAGHDDLPRALAALKALDSDARKPQHVVEAAWVVAALAAARPAADVEAHLAAARDRLLDSRHSGRALFPHATRAGMLPWYRSHVSCYADQVYPIQALARLHRSGDDPVALRAATACADRICELQGAGGQWWWHYDARTDKVVEGYPVYTVHQHAMGPMALLDLTEAGGPSYRGPIERGLRWITDPLELRGVDGAEDIIRAADGVTWRKVYRGDPRKVVRAASGLTSKLLPGRQLPGVNRVYKPLAVDRECRPYEFGWLFFAWLNREASS
jgi:hypothetical protein